MVQTLKRSSINISLCLIHPAQWKRYSSLILPNDFEFIIQNYMKFKTFQTCLYAICMMIGVFHEWLTFCRQTVGSGDLDLPRFTAVQSGTFLPQQRTSSTMNGTIHWKLENILLHVICIYICVCAPNHILGRNLHPEDSHKNALNTCFNCKNATRLLPM